VFEHVEGIRKKNRHGALPAAGVAALLHVLLIALLTWGIRSKVLLAINPPGTGPALAFPEGGGGGGGGGGQEVVSYVEVAPPAPQPEETVVETVPEEDVLIPPEPTPVPEPPKQEVPKTETPQQRPPAAAPAPSTGGQDAGSGGGAGPGSGPGEGSGTGPGSGSGSGGGNGSGTGSGNGDGNGGGGGGRIRPPANDVLPIPPDRPNGVASQEIKIRVTVDVRGRVRDARLVTSTGNRGYDERIRRWALTLVWRPAVDTTTNRPVEAATEVTIWV
jgi:protein TonB